MKVIELLDSKVSEMIKSRVAFGKHYSKKELKEYIQMLETQHLSVIRSLEGVADGIGSKIGRKLKADTRKYQAYTNFTKYLNNKSASKEASKFTSTMLDANKTYVKLLSGVLKDIDTLFPFEKINMLNMRVSHVVVSGIVEESKILTRYTKYMFGYVSSTMAGAGELPKYRLAYLQDNAKQYANIINDIEDNTGAVDYKAIISKIKSSGEDYTLVGKDAKSQVGGNLRFGRSTDGIVTSGVLGLPGFRSIGEAVNILRKEISIYLRQEEDWMRGHVALLSANAGDMAETDPEYIKLKKIIERYESMIDMIERVRKKVE